MLSYDQRYPTTPTPTLTGLQRSHAPQSVVQHQNIVKHSCEIAQQKREITKLKRNEDASDARVVTTCGAGRAAVGAKLPDPGFKPTRKGCGGCGELRGCCTALLRLHFYPVALALKFY